jgi:flagellar export protein FliJ
MQLMREHRAYGEIEKTISQFKSKQSHVAQKCHHAGLNGVNASLYQTYQLYLDRLRHDIEEAYNTLKEKEKKIREQEMVLKKETTKKKALEKLRERQFEAYQNMTEKVEQNNLDELVINRRGAMP